jgi:hypothetical protein
MSFRRILSSAALLVVVLIIVGQLRHLLEDPTIWPPDDFVEYWAAAKLTLAGKNPYDPTLLLPLQQSAGRETDKAIMMWNPPWSLAIVLPLGLLPAREAQLLWLAVNLLAIGYCGDRLWLLLGGSRDRRWVGWLVVLTALPTAFALQSGQIGPILLLGAVLFLECQKRGWQFCVGAATVFLAVKPHLAYLIWLAILFDAVKHGRWRVLAGGATAGLACTFVAFAFDRQVVQQYVDALGNRPPAEWASPTIGTVLRLVFGEELFRLQFIPVVFGLFWFVWHWRRLQTASSMEDRSWDWCEQVPLLLLVSFVTAPYGAWPFDMVLLLPAVIWLIINVGWRMSANGQYILAALLSVNIGCLVLNLLHVNSFWFLWVSPTVLGIYLIGRRLRPRQVSSDSASVFAKEQTLVTA